MHRGTEEVDRRAEGVSRGGSFQKEKAAQPRKERTMKTKLSDRKLKLQRETLRELTAKALGQVRGGEVYETIVRPTDACGHPKIGRAHV